MNNHIRFSQWVRSELAIRNFDVVYVDPICGPPYYAVSSIGLCAKNRSRPYYKSGWILGENYKNPDSWYAYIFTTGMFWWKKKRVNLVRYGEKLTQLSKEEEELLCKAIEHALEVYETVVKPELIELEVAREAALHWKELT